jgi:hypothetical protein
MNSQSFGKDYRDIDMDKFEFNKRGAALPSCAKQLRVYSNCQHMERRDAD